MKNALALPLISIGETLLNALAGTGTSGKSGKHLLGGADFGSQLRQKLDQISGERSNPLLSQLASLIQNGTPLSAIIDRIAKELSSALAGASGNGGNTERRRVLQRALASALAPPGASPPGQAGTAAVSSLSKGTALERRLKNIVSSVSRELQNAGQQNRFPGAVLDAATARETPAQQKTEYTAGTQVPAGAIPSAEAILQRVVAQLAAAPGSAPGKAAHTAPPVSHITVQSADVLGRMLARAANVQSQQSGKPPAAGQVQAAQAQPAPAPHYAAPTQSPSQLFTRLLNVIAQSAGEHASGQDGKHGTQFAFGKNGNVQIHHAQSANSGITAPAFTTAVTTASASSAQPSASAPAATAVVDPQSVIEQVVKGIVLRNAGSTSELRMRLQPEHLGDVSLKLTVTGNTVAASVIAQNADVRDMLLGNQQQLARTLAQAGLTLGKFSVDVSGGNPGFHHQQTAQQRSLSKAASLHVGALMEEDTWTDERFGPPVLAGSRSLVLNYLA